MAKDWKELAAVGSWLHVNRFVKTFRVDVPISEVEMSRMDQRLLAELILERARVLIEEHLGLEPLPDELRE